MSLREIFGETLLPFNFFTLAITSFFQSSKILNLVYRFFNFCNITDLLRFEVKSDGKRGNDLNTSENFIKFQIYP
jgi:hypothetical protein